MENQKLESLHPTQAGKIPAKWEEKFLIKRIGEEDIEITLTQRDSILGFLNAGQKFVQVDKYTLMLNSIKSIDPKWGANNIPPRPEEKWDFNPNKDGSAMEKILLNEEEIKEWESLFG